MADPFGVLRTPVSPAEPDAGFAARLRARLEHALDLPRGVAVSQKAFQETSAVPAPPPAAAGDDPMRQHAAPRHGDIGYASLWVPDAGRAAAFYAAVLGWSYEPGSGPRSRQVRGVTPRQGLHGGEPRPTLYCAYAVTDTRAAVARVRAAGGQAGEPAWQPYGLAADCTDDQGIPFTVFDAGGDPGGPGPAEPARDGDLAYITFEVADSARARAFYGTVLGWQFSQGSIEDGWQIAGTFPRAGLSGGHPQATAVPLWRVADVGAAVGRVRAAGGTCTDPHREPYGLITECTDDQGTRFTLGQF